MVIFATKELDLFLKPQNWGNIPDIFQNILQEHSLSLQTLEYTSSPSDLQGKHSHTAKSCRNLSAFFRECSMKVQYSEANNLIIMLLLLDEKCSDIL